MWKSLGCAVQGSGHMANNIPCQDKVASLSENGVSVIALADGAGSARLSHFGAEEVTKFICKKLCSDFDFMFSDNSEGTVAKTVLLKEINTMLEVLAEKHNCNVQDLSSTLLTVAVREDDVLAIHLGDGVIGCLKNDELLVISSPENGEYANQTVFTTSKNASSSIRLIKGQVKDKVGFVLLSDGSCASLYDKKRNCLSNGIKKIIESGFYNKSTALNEQLLESFKYDIRSRTNDDCSIAIIYKDSEKFPGYLNLTSEEKKAVIKTDSFNRFYNDSDRIIRFVSKDNGKTMYEIRSWFHKKPSRIRHTIRRLERLSLVYEKNHIFMPVIKISATENNLVSLDSYYNNVDTSIFGS